MRRAPFVATATIAGLAGILAFHTAGASSTFAPARSTTTTTTPGGGATQPTTAGVSTTTLANATRSAIGDQVNYNYGLLSVKVTVVDRKLTAVTVASLDDGGNFRSQMIDQQAIPLLQQEALAAQSANIQSISGASYTSWGFQQSLQSALTKLGL